MISLALTNAGLTLVVGLVGALLVTRLPTLRGRLVGLALVATCAPIAGLTGSGVVMLESSHDLVLLASAGGASLAALAGAWLVARSVLRPVADLASVTHAMGSGDLAARAETTGPTELAGLARSFNAMADDVEALFDARQELVAWAGHDLRAPLTALRAMIEAVEDGVAPADRYLSLMRERVAALSAIVDDLLEVARVNGRGDDAGREPVVVAPIIHACIDTVRAAADARTVTITVAPLDDRLTVRCAAPKLARALTNLAANAVAHAPSGGVVLVSASEAAVNQTVSLTVEDSGAGFAAGEEARAFEPFWRADRARSDGGAGLGLTIARGLVEAHGGRVTIGRSELGGALLTITLPR